MLSGTYQVSKTWKFTPAPPPTPPRARVSICTLPREPFFIYEDEQAMHLLMTTYSQDIMTNSGCVFFFLFLAFSPFIQQA